MNKSWDHIEFMQIQIAVLETHVRVVQGSRGHHPLWAQSFCRQAERLIRVHSPVARTFLLIICWVSLASADYYLLISFDVSMLRIPG